MLCVDKSPDCLAEAFEASMETAMSTAETPLLTVSNSCSWS